MDRVVVTAVGKRYQPYPRRFVDLLRLVRRGGWNTRPSTWALREVSFTLADGDSVGIIGMNGAGKSTLLRILTGTTMASEGQVRVNGRVSALLELGLGMHGDFTGAQNALLMCELMGFDAAEIRARLPWIEQFAELGAAIDQPVRTYSAGMQLRLAFSAAAAVRPDVLIVDEVLAVGDAYFQHKCVERIRAFQQAGTTLILVTHDLAAVRALCSRALLLDQGRVLQDGPTPAVADFYNALIAARTQTFDIMQTTEPSGGRTTTRSGTKEAEIVAVELTGADDLARDTFTVGAHVKLHLRIRLRRTMTMPTIGFLIRDRLGIEVFGTNTHLLALDAAPDNGAQEGPLPNLPPSPEMAMGQDISVCFAVTLNLGPGSYAISVAAHQGRTHLESSLDWWDHALTFTVTGDHAPFVGLAALPVRATITAAVPTSNAATLVAV